MKKNKRLTLIAMLIMVILSFTNLFGVKIAGTTVILGIVFFFFNKLFQKQSFKVSGLDLLSIKSNLKNKTIWFWIALPIIMDALSITIGILFFPEYIDHVLERTEDFISFDKLLSTVILLAILALGEEIAWRAFFQNQFNRIFSIVPTLIITSLLFALGHFNEGKMVVVTFDILLVFINSILYGTIFKKTNNAWISSISHFLANLFSVIVLLFI